MSRIAHEGGVEQRTPPRPCPEAVLGHRVHHPLLDVHLHEVHFRMLTKAAGCERAEKRPPQVGAPGNQVDGSGDIPQAEADLADLAAFQRLLGAISPRSPEREPRPQLGPCLLYTSDAAD